MQEGQQYGKMHAYLIHGSDPKKIDRKIIELSNRLKAKVVPFNISGIEDVRLIENFTKHTLLESSILLIRNVELASNQALNAFLKNLEEPQENLFYILTATKINSLPDTVISRCQIIKLKQKELENNELVEIKKFLALKSNEMLLHIEKYRSKNDALVFLNNLLLFEKNSLTTKGQDIKKTTRNLFFIDRTIRAINGNANPFIQLSSLILSIYQT